MKQVFAAMGQEVSFERPPANRAWRMIASGERDGLIYTTRTGEREEICSFPDAPLHRDRVALSVRTADFGKLKLPSCNDLVGHASRAMKQFKQTEAYQAIYRECFP